MRTETGVQISEAADEGGWGGAMTECRMRLNSEHWSEQSQIALFVSGPAAFGERIITVRTVCCLL